jgi:hypothetical protein
MKEFMMTAKLLEIIQTAANQIDTYRHPDLQLFQAAVDPVLAALGESTIDSDSVESIYVGHKYVRITTSYYCRGCHNTSDSTIPMEIVEAADPVKAATEHVLRSKVAQADAELKIARDRIPRLEEMSRKAAQELNAFLSKAD